MTISLVNIGTNGGTSQASATGTSVTVGVGGVPAGSLIVACFDISLASATLTVCVDTAGNTYNIADSMFAGGTTSGVTYYAYNCLALVQNNTITVKSWGGSRTVGLSCFYATGVLSTSNPLDVAATTSGGATGTTSTPSLAMRAVPATAGSLIVGHVGYANNSAFTQDSTNAAYATPPNLVLAGTVQTTAGGAVVSSSQLTYAPTFGTAGRWTEQIAVFAPAPTAAVCRGLTLLGVGCYLADRSRSRVFMPRRDIVSPWKWPKSG